MKHFTLFFLLCISFASTAKNRSHCMSLSLKCDSTVVHAYNERSHVEFTYTITNCRDSNLVVGTSMLPESHSRYAPCYFEIQDYNNRKIYYEIQIEQVLDPLLSENIVLKKGQSYAYKFPILYYYQIINPGKYIVTGFYKEVSLDSDGPVFTSNSIVITIK